MKKDIRIIALDLDGTLLNSNKELTQRNYDALVAAAAKGIQIVPTTGRFYDAMPQVIRDLPFVNYAITINGAQVRNVHTGQVLYRAEIPWQQAVEVMTFLDTLPVIYDCFMDDAAWMTAALKAHIEECTDNPHYRKMLHELRQDVQANLAVQVPLAAGAKVVHQGLVVLLGDDADSLDAGVGHGGELEVDHAITAGDRQRRNGAHAGQFTEMNVVFTGVDKAHYVFHVGVPPYCASASI